MSRQVHAPATLADGKAECQHGRAIARLAGPAENNRREKGIAPMTFQAYLDNIRAKTGKTPEQFKALAAKAHVYSADMKATVLVAWLKKEFGLGHGHSMAIWKVFQDKGWVKSGKRR
jgi:hypothetical protein